jgi:hypothetical protein
MFMEKTGTEGGVHVPHLRCGGDGGDRHQLVPGGDDPHPGPPVHPDVVLPGRGQNTKILGQEPPALREHHPSSGKVLSPGQDVLACRHRPADEYQVPRLLGMLHHHDGISPIREHRPGRYVHALARSHPPVRLPSHWHRACPPEH